MPTCRTLAATALAFLIFVGALFGRASAQPEISPLPYIQGDIRDTSTGARKRAQVGIALANPGQEFTPQEVAATCIAAAKFYAAKLKVKAVGVFISDLPGDKPWQGTRIGQCSYSPDNGGWSGSQGWMWTDVKAAKHNITDQERAFKKLWGELRPSYQRNGATDEEGLSKAIASKMEGVKPEDVTLPYLFLEGIDWQPLQETAPAGPVNQ